MDWLWTFLGGVAGGVAVMLMQDAIKRAYEWISPTVWMDFWQKPGGAGRKIYLRIQNGSDRPISLADASIHTNDNGGGNIDLCLSIPDSAGSFVLDTRNPRRADELPDPRLYAQPGAHIELTGIVYSDRVQSELPAVITLKYDRRGRRTSRRTLRIERRVGTNRYQSANELDV